uniref:Basic phospholipase A2 caudoxin n=1 Tax=Bitis caudalis TaxID=8693 RepID=PA2B_BITCA|nr:RecName: Full=Basic phospholipase A2 caudoxin; Short=svPLA2; AltName: Full=Phosphatidylcholine 2-acylhydrolase [Bitis caudalis]
NLIQFGNMISAMTGKSSLAYASYGCYCGWGGKGQPKDDTDRCCFVHDCCYGKADKCSPKMILYSYKFHNGNIVCGDKNACKKKVCECDRVAAICFAASKHSYNKNLWRYPSSKCTGTAEKC